MTAHYELLKDDKGIRIISLKDANINLEIANRLFIDLNQLILKMYVIINGGEYQTDIIERKQLSMAVCLAGMLPITTNKLKSY